MAEHPASGALASSAPAAESNLEVLSRIGHMTRALHDSLRGLGLDKLIEKAASDIPDARDRLDYVARMSEQAAPGRPRSTPPRAAPTGAPWPSARWPSWKARAPPPAPPRAT